MHSVHISTKHAPFDHRIYWKECCGLSNVGWKVSLLQQQSELRSPSNDGNVEIIPLFSKPVTSKGSILRYVGNFIKILIYLVRRRPDIIHVHDPELLPLVFFRRLLFSFFVFDAHELLLTQQRDNGYLRRALSISAVNLTRYCDLVVCAADTVRIAYSKYSNNLSTVSNYPLDSFFTPVGLYPSNSFTFIYAGSLSEKRNLDLVLRAYERLVHVHDERVQLVIVTNSPTRDLQQLAKLLNIDDTIHIVTSPAYNEIPTYLSRASCGINILPNIAHYRYAPTSVKLYEYWAAGLPSIVSNFPEWKKRLGDHDFVFFADPEDVDSIEIAMLSAMNSISSNLCLGEHSQQYCKANFSWSRELEKLSNAYESLPLR